MKTINKVNNIKNIMDKQSLLTAKQVSQMLNIGLSTVYAYADAKIIPAIYFPRCGNSMAKQRNKQTVRFRVDVIEEFVHNLEQVDSNKIGGD